jgi:hypothetical protein
MLRAQVESLTNERNLQANQFRLLREALAIGSGAGPVATAAGVGSGVSGAGTNGASHMRASNSVPALGNGRVAASGSSGDLTGYRGAGAAKSAQLK